VAEKRKISKVRVRAKVADENTLKNHLHPFSGFDIYSCQTNGHWAITYTHYRSVARAETALKQYKLLQY